MKAQGRITVGRRAKDGQDAVRYYLLPSNTQATVSTSGVVSPSKVTVKQYRQVGKSSAVVTTDGVIKYQTVSKNGTTSSESTYPTSGVTLQASFSTVIFSLYVNGTKVDTVSVAVVADGINGTDGKSGIQGCIIRQTEWDSNGFEYHNDYDLTTFPRFLDIVLVEIKLSDKLDGYIKANGKYFKAYMCLKTHKSSKADAVNPIKNEQYPTYWRPLDYMAPIYTPLIWAEYAYLQMAQTNQILITNNDKVSGGFGGGNPALWLGAEEFEKAPFRVNQLGKAWLLDATLQGGVVAGNPDGQHIHIDPESKSMVIYDSSNSAVSFFEGNSHTSLTSLTGGSSGEFTMNNENKNKSFSVDGNNSSTQHKTETLRLSSSVYSEAPIELIIYGTMSAYATPADTVSDSSGGSFGSGLNESQIQQPQMMASGSSSLALYIVTYTSSLLTTVKNKTLVASVIGSSPANQKNLNNTRIKTPSGGYHVLEMTYIVSASGIGKSASVAWGTNVVNGTTFKASYVSDFYVSRFFANGFCLAKSAQNYIWAYNQGDSGMRLVMENNGFGIDVSNAGIKIKHHSGNWFNMPMFLFHALYEFEGDKYTLKNNRSWDGNYPTCARIAEGRVRITFPATWLSSLSFTSLSDIEISIIGLGYTSGSTTSPIKATVIGFTPSSGQLLIDLSDDSSRNDGSFMIDLKYLG